MIKRHKLTFLIGIIGITIVTLIFLISDYRDLGYISFNGSILAPIGMLVGLLVIIREDDRKENK